MSHVTRLDISIKHLSDLATACEALGLELVEGRKKYKWFGRSVGDTPLPDGYNESDLGKCEHAIRIPGNSQAYEIGVVSRRDGQPGYELLWDSWAGGYGMVAAVGEGAGKLKQEYTVAVGTRHYQHKGYRVRREDHAGGVRLHCVR